MQRSIRFPDDLDARIAKLAADEDRAFSWVVLRTLEKALGESSAKAGVAAPRPAPSRPPTSARTPSPLAARQAALNKSKGM